MTTLMLKLALIGVALVVCVATAVKRPPRKNEALYKCLNTQVCGCGMASRFDECWKKLTDNGKKWLIDELNKCEIDGATLPYGTIEEWSSIMCPLGEGIKKPCYHEINQKLMERLQETGRGDHGEAEAVAFEMARKCMEPNLASCTAFPDECMSVG